MRNKLTFTLHSLTYALLLLAACGATTHAQTKTTANQPEAKGQANPPAPQAGNATVTGSGTSGRLSKWSGVAGASTFTLGDSLIFENKNGLLGIGTDSPTSKLTVAGMVETTLGGYKFPDGTVQTTAAVGLQSVFHNSTLAGNGTQSSPLGLAIPLMLDTSAASSVFLIGLDASATAATLIVQNQKGDGIYTQGGSAIGLNGPEGTSGLKATGGSSLGNGGAGVDARGGSSGIDKVGGTGVEAAGGSPFQTTGDGGIGVFAFGGTGIGMGHKGGNGLEAYAGSGNNGGINGSAGLFHGAVEVQGNFNVTGGGTKNFKIDHPLDPENKYLYHAAIESSEVLNIYSGNVTTDENGEAVVALPDWFEAVNRDFRYQLTVVGTFAQAIVGNKVKTNRFIIKTNAPGVEVSWQVTGIRADAAIRKHPFKVEEDKPQTERGSYLSPEAYGQPEEKGIDWARNSELMKQRKAAKEENESRQQRLKQANNN